MPRLTQKVISVLILLIIAIMVLVLDKPEKLVAKQELAVPFRAPYIDCSQLMRPDSTINCEYLQQLFMELETSINQSHNELEDWLRQIEGQL